MGTALTILLGVMGQGLVLSCSFIKLNFECCITYPPGGKLKELCIVANAQLEIDVNIQVAFFKARCRGEKYSLINIAGRSVDSFNESKGKGCDLTAMNHSCHYN